jgi:hypothetical protein
MNDEEYLYFFCGKKSGNFEHCQLILTINLIFLKVLPLIHYIEMKRRKKLLDQAQKFSGKLKTYRKN